MNRPRSYTIAAVLMVFYSLFGSIDSLPRLARGASESAQAIAGQPGPPYVLVVIDFVVAVVGLVAAYGILRMQKWSVVLGICVAASNHLRAPAVSASDGGARRRLERGDYRAAPATPPQVDHGRIGVLGCASDANRTEPSPRDDGASGPAWLGAPSRITLVVQ